MLNKTQFFIIEIHLFIDLTPYLKKINDSYFLYLVGFVAHEGARFMRHH